MVWPVRGRAAPSISPAACTNQDVIRRSTSFKSKELLYKSNMGCTNYCEGFPNENNKSIISPCVNVPKSRNINKQLKSMHKTSANWNCSRPSKPTKIAAKLYADSGIGSNNSHETCYNIRSIIRKNVLPIIESFNKKQFHADCVSNKNDTYIAYIKSVKKQKEEDTNINKSIIRCERKIGGNYQTAFARKLSRNKPVDTKSFVMNGINFEVHSKRGVSPTESVEHLKSNISKEMNLMLYDFNGASRRLGNEAKNIKNSSKYNSNVESTIKKIYLNNTSERFYKGRDRNQKQKVNNTTSTHDGTYEKLSKIEEESQETDTCAQDNYVYPLSQITNNSIIPHKICF
jgi:hypothetical protein